MNRPSHRLDPLTITHQGYSHQVPIESQYTFGRQADLIIDAENRALHRHVGRIYCNGHAWILENCGASITLILSDEHSPSYARVAAGISMPLPFAHAIVTFSAGHANYRLSLHQSDREERVIPASRCTVPGDQDDLTFSISRLKFNSEQLELLQRLAAPRLLGPISSADLPTNRELADLLNWSMSKLVRKLDHLCVKLDRAGVSGLVPSPQRSATDRRVVLANMAVENGLVRSRVTQEVTLERQTRSIDDQ